MANYSDFYRLLQAGEIKRLTYLCGDEPALIQSAVNLLVDSMDVGVENYVSLVAGDVPDKDVWAAMNQYALDPTQKRLVVVYNAEKLKSVKHLEDWLNSRHMPNSYVIMASNLDDWPYKMELKEGKKVKVYIHPDVRDRVVKSGRFVGCSFPKAEESRQRQVAEYITELGTISINDALYLYRRVGEDLGKCRDVMLKASFFSGTVTEKVIDFLAQEAPDENYVKALLSRRVAVAATAARTVPVEKVPAIFGQLESDLFMLNRINRSIKRDQTSNQLATQMGVHRVQIDSLRDWAKYYDEQRTYGCAQALQASDLAWRRGARDGVLEMLAATW